MDELPQPNVAPSADPASFYGRTDSLREGWASRRAFLGVAAPGLEGRVHHGPSSPVQAPAGDRAPAARLRRLTCGQAFLCWNPGLPEIWAQPLVPVGGTQDPQVSMLRTEGWSQNLASSTDGRRDFR